MLLSKERKISIYLYIVLLVNHLGVQLPFLSFMKGNNQIILAGLLLVVGFLLFNQRRRMPTHSFGMKVFYILLVTLAISIVMAYIIWNQDFITSILLYRNHIWTIYIPLLLYIKPTLKSISNALFALTLTALLVWIGQAIGIIHYEFRESITGEIIDSTNEFGGYGIYAARTITFALYIFLSEMSLDFSKENLIKVIITIVTIVFASQRALLLFALPIMAFTFLFKINLKKVYKIAVTFMFIILAVIFFVQTSDVWYSFIEETSKQLGDKDYNRWLAVDYFLNRYNTGISTAIFGNGFLSLHNYGGRLLYELGYLGIFIDDVGMIGVWVRYGIIPLIITYYLIVKVLRSKTMPLYMKYSCVHIGFLPTSWTLIGPHYFVLIFLIYLYCINLNKKTTPNISIK